MNSVRHALLGATVAVLPDVVLATYGWRKTWLPETHPLVRAHRFLHRPEAVVAAAWASHVIADRYSRHRTGPRQMDDPDAGNRTSPP